MQILSQLKKLNWFDFGSNEAHCRVHFVIKLNKHKMNYKEELRMDTPFQNLHKDR